MRADFNIQYQNLVQEIEARVVSENVGFGYRTSEAVVEAWIKSEGHRENIEGSNTHFGISVDQDQNGKKYFTIFSREDNRYPKGIYLNESTL